MMVVVKKLGIWMVLALLGISWHSLIWGLVRNLEKTLRKHVNKPAYAREIRHLGWAALADDMDSAVNALKVGQNLFEGVLSATQNPSTLLGQ